MDAETYLSAALGRLLDDPRHTLLSEGAGCHGLTRGISAAGREDRLIRATLSEGATCGLAAGLAMAGRRVVVECVDPKGAARAASALQDAAGLHRRSEGAWQAPLAVLAPAGTELSALPKGVSAWEAAAAAEVPGLIRLALDGRAPAIILLPDLHGEAGEGAADKGADKAPAPAEILTRAGGEGCTVLVRGGGRAAALDAALQQAGLGIEVVLIRRLAPLDPGPILESVSRTGRAVIVDSEGGPLAEGAARLLISGAFWRLLSPPITVDPAGAASGDGALSAAIIAAVQQSLAEGQ